MGHAGTLDPLATGLLIIGLDKATKELARFMGHEKEYEVLIEFGKISTSYDADGSITDVITGAAKQSSQSDLEKILPNFIGTISQMPPAFSAKRINGVHAYDLAREGKTPDLKPATIEIKSIEVLEFNWPFARLRVTCGKGTYIRSLAHDIGQKLGCGGYVKELRRTRIGDMKVENAQKI
jgi:tRNA pseudouridine55 synthase